MDFFNREEEDETLPWDQNSANDQPRGNIYLDKDIKVENLDQSKANLLNVSVTSERKFKVY